MHVAQSPPAGPAPAHRSAVRGRRRRWRSILVAVPATALVGTAAAAFAPWPSSAATVDTGAWHVLVKRNSGRALDVYNPYRFGIFKYATQALGGAVTARRFELSTP